MTKEISRRRLLQLAALGGTATAVGAVGLWRAGSTNGRLITDGGGEFLQPDVVESENGLLEVTLEAGSGVRLAGQDTAALGYNGGSPGPTWRVRPGDLMRVDLVNRLAEPTNLHVHGLHVSPEGNGDNVFVEVPPGGSFGYEHRLPDDHPAGTYWYHPHHHGFVADQLFGGLAGAIIVQGDAEPPVDQDRVLLITDITLSADGRVVTPSFQERMMGREGELVVVNGVLQPTLSSRRGAVERWRVINGCTSRFLRLRLDDSDLVVLGRDGIPVIEPVVVDEIVLAPGNRADVLIEVPGEGRYRLVTEPYDRGGMGMGPMMRGGRRSTEPAVVAVLDVAAGSATPRPLRWDPPVMEDLREGPVHGQRELVFNVSMGMGRMSFTIDGREFDPERVDTTVRVGAVEEWVIRNPSPMDHPFHLHVWPVQLIDDGSGPLDEVAWRDVVNVPAGGEVRIRVRFADFGGRTVYHCHILDHEDQGMMGVVVAS